MLKGSLRYWPVVIGERRVPALLLGPVAVLPEDRGKGYARALIWDSLEVARRLGYGIVLLVGDEPYYVKFGFTRAFTKALELPGPVDLNRFLGLELGAARASPGFPACCRSPARTRRGPPISGMDAAVGSPPPDRSRRLSAVYPMKGLPACGD